MHKLAVPAIIEQPGTGHNSQATLKELGIEGRKAIKAFDRSVGASRRSAAEAQVHALNLGRILDEGKSACASTKEYGVWITAQKLDQGSLGSQTELNACWHLYQRVIVEKQFTLEGCDITTPTNIMKWARRQHAHLFEQRPRAKKRVATLIEQIVDAVRETPLDIGAKLFAELKGSKELSAFKRALQGRVE